MSAPDDDDLPPPLALTRHQTTTDPHGGGAQSARALTGQALVSFVRVGAPVVSPSGAFVAFSARSLVGDESFCDDDADVPMLQSKDDKFHSRLFVLDVASRAIVPLTRPPSGSDSSPVWTDDDTLLFLSTRSGSSQLWSVARSGGEAVQLTRFPVSIGDLKFNAARSLAFFSASVHPGAGSMAASVAKDEAAKAAPTNYQVHDKLFVRSWDKWCDGKRSHIFVAHLVPRGNSGWKLNPRFPVQDLMAGKDTDCPTPPFGGAESYDVSPDGETFAYSASATAATSADAWSTNHCVYTADLNDIEDSGLGKLELVVGPHVPVGTGSIGVDSHPVFSADGTRLALFSMTRPGYESDRNRIMIFNLATSALTELAPEWDRSAGDMTWGPDDACLYVTAAEEGRSRVFRVDATAPAAEVQTVLADCANSGVAVLGNNELIFSRSSFCYPAELFKCTLGGGSVEQLTHFNARRMELVQLATPEEFRFQGGRAESVHAWFFKPSGFSAANEAAQASTPLTVMIHGGPQGSFTDSFHYRWNPQTLATQGYAVLIVNFHGSTGYGQAFTDSVSGDWGGAPYEDIMKGVDFCLSKYPFLDAARIGALGASYGGYMINWINGHTDRFKCLVNHDGVFNLETMALGTEELFFVEWEMRGQIWESDLYAKWSPHKHAHKFATPCLVIHGGRDYRVMDVEGISAFTALQRRGIESKLLYFPEENHWVLSPHNSVAWHSEVLAWLARFLKPE